MMAMIRTWFGAAFSTEQPAKPPTQALDAVLPQLASVHADEIALTEELRRNENMIDVWQHRATRAAYNGNDVDARLALSCRIDCETRALELRQELARHRETSRRLREALSPLERAARAERRGNALAAVLERRASAAESIAAGHAGIEDRTRAATHRENAAIALVDLRGDPIEAEFSRHERAEHVDVALAALKQDLNARRKLST